MLNLSSETLGLDLKESAHPILLVARIFNKVTESSYMLKCLMCKEFIIIFQRAGNKFYGYGRHIYVFSEEVVVYERWMNLVENI